MTRLHRNVRPFLVSYSTYNAQAQQGGGAPDADASQDNGADASKENDDKDDVEDVDFEEVK